MARSRARPLVSVTCASRKAKAGLRTLMPFFGWAADLPVSSFYSLTRACDAATHLCATLVVPALARVGHKREPVGGMETHQRTASPLSLEQLSP